MKNQQNKKDIPCNLVMNNVDLSEQFRKNLLFYAGERNITMVEIANKSDVPINTINSFLHRISNDMKVSNVAKIARALNVSIDELVGADTLHDLTKESLAVCRNLPENDLYLVRWFIRYLDDLNKKTEPNKRYISAIIPILTNNGDFKISSNYEKIEITDLKEPLKSKIFVGCKITSDHYMPHYMPGDIILIANDRPPKPNENVVVRTEKYLFIAKQKIENGIAKYYSIRDGKYRMDESEVDELIGYIAYRKRA